MAGISVGIIGVGYWPLHLLNNWLEWKTGIVWLPHSPLLWVPVTIGVFGLLVRVPAIVGMKADRIPVSLALAGAFLLLWPLCAALDMALIPSAD